MDFTEKTLSSEYIFKGKILKLRVDEVELPNGKKARREVTEHSGAVAVLPVTDDGKAMLVRQFRYAYKQHLIEIPAGKIDPGEDPETAVRREMREEINRACDELTFLGMMYPAPGAQYEPVYIYLARKLSVCDGTPDEDEFVETILMDVDELIAKVTSGEIRDAKTCVAVLKYALMRKE